MSFLEFKKLQENSLYSNQQEKDALVADKQKLMDSLLINYFGFLGIFKISSKRGPMQHYSTEEQKLFPNNIGDSNKDVSLSVKLALDAGLIKSTTAMAMTKLLVLIKQKSIKSEELDDDKVRDILNDIVIGAHRPHVYVQKAIDKFKAKEIDLKHLAEAMFKIVVAHKKELLPIAGEFKALGDSFKPYFVKMDSIKDLDSTSPTQPAVQQTTAQKIAAGDIKQKVSTQAAPAPVAPAKLGKVDAFWKDLFNARGASAYNAVFKEYGVNGVSFQEAVAKMELILPDSIDGWEKTWARSQNIPSDYFYRPFITNKLQSITKMEELVAFRASLGIGASSGFDNFFRMILKNSFKSKFIALLSKWLDGIDSKEEFKSRPVETNLIRNWIGILGHFSNLASELSKKNVFKLFKMSDADNRYFKNLISEYFPNRVLDSWGVDSFDIKEWNAHVPADIREVWKAFGINGGVSIVDASMFDTELNAVSNISELSNLAFKYANLSASTSKILDPDSSKKVIDFLVKKTKEDTRGFTIGTVDTYYGVDRFSSTIDFSKTAYKDISEVADELGNDFFDKIIKGLVDGSINPDSFVSNLSSAYSYFGKFMSMNPFDMDKRLGLSIDSKFPGAREKIINKMFEQIDSLTYNARQLLSALGVTDLVDRIVKTLGPNNYHKLFGYDTFSRYNVYDSDISKESFDKVFDMWVANRFLNGNKQQGSTPFYQMRSVLSQAAREKVRDWLRESLDKLPANLKPEYIFKMILTEFPDFEFSEEELNKLDFEYMASKLSYIKGNEKALEVFGKKFLALVDNDDVPNVTVSEHIKTMIRHDENILSSFIHDETAQKDIDKLVERTLGLLDARTDKKFDRKSWSYVAKDKYGFDLKCATTLMHTIGSRVFDAPAGQKAVETFAEILQKRSSIDKEYRESVLTDISNLFTNADITPATELAFSKFEKSTQKMLAVNFAMAQFAGEATKEINEAGPIKPRSKLPKKGALKVLKLNQVTIPSSDVIDFRKYKSKGVTLKDVQDAAIGAATTFKLEKQAIEEQDHSEETLEKMSVAYNKFNRYKHGHIAIKINKVFTVNMTKQNQEWSDYLAQFSGQSGYYTSSPQFHGTASLPASMILRYGFSVIDEGLARSAGIKYAGRMLGDGIYSSNVLDKVSQYINDDAPSGVSRQRGVVGYIFQMECQGSSWTRNLNTSGDWASGGGVVAGDRGGLVSPEWAWKYPSKQMKIVKCFEITIINKDEMDALVAKHKDVVEAVERYKSFNDYLIEAKRPKVEKYSKYASFTFMDNFVPIGNGKYADLNEGEEVKLPSNARIDFGRYGVTIQFEHNEDLQVRLLYGTDIETNYEVRKLYSKLLGKKV